jgi:TonB family protein
MSMTSRPHVGIGSVSWLDRIGDSVGRPKRYAAVTFALLLHLAVTWFVATVIPGGIWLSASVGKATELEVRLISPNLVSRGMPAPPTDWSFLTPDENSVPEPVIDILPEPQAPSNDGVAVTREKLPPRFDPSHVNERPQLPRSVAMIGALVLELNVLVLPDGSVGDARVIKSTGNPDIDRVAIQTVMGSWRYIPATIGGKPVEAWTAVIVRFAPI